MAGIEGCWTIDERRDDAGNDGATGRVNELRRDDVVDDFGCSGTENRLGSFGLVEE